MTCFKRVDFLIRELERVTLETPAVTSLRTCLPSTATPFPTYIITWI